MAGFGGWRGGLMAEVAPHYRHYWRLFLIVVIVCRVSLFGDRKRVRVREMYVAVCLV